jgi:hypothetical protein
MPGYRLYFLDSDRGRLQMAHQIHSADDVRAICPPQELSIQAYSNYGADTD